MDDEQAFGTMESQLRAGHLRARAWVGVLMVAGGLATLLFLGAAVLVASMHDVVPQYAYKAHLWLIALGLIPGGIRVLRVGFPGDAPGRPVPMSQWLPLVAGLSLLLAGASAWIFLGTSAQGSSPCHRLIGERDVASLGGPMWNVTRDASDEGGCHLELAPIRRRGQSGVTNMTFRVDIRAAATDQDIDDWVRAIANQSEEVAGLGDYARRVSASDATAVGFRVGQVGALLQFPHAAWTNLQIEAAVDLCRRRGPDVLSAQQR